MAVVVCLSGWCGLASGITVDGVMDPGEWSGANLVITDPLNPALDANNDIYQITMADGHHGLYVGLSVYGDHVNLAASGSAYPYLNFYFNMYAGGGAPYRLGLSYNDGYGFPRGQMHLIDYTASRWVDLGTVDYAIDKALEVFIPWGKLPAGLTGGGVPITIQNLFFLYNVAPGDANNDGQVDGTDLTALSNNWRRTGATWADGDFNLDGVVDAIDLTMLANHWGYIAPDGAPHDMWSDGTVVDRNLPLTNHVPEPITMFGAFMGISSLGMYIRRRTKVKAV